MSDTVTALVAAAGAVVTVMVVTWVASLVRRDASLVDRVWGFGFVVAALVVAHTVEGNDTRQWFLFGMTALWGLRLSAYLTWRNWGHGEDFRYQSMRKHYGDRFPVISLITVFGVQGVLMWVVALPVTLGQVPKTPDVGAVAGVGVALWALGLTFETVGDLQLARFKRDPANKDQVMDRGLWRYTRHPNYFGDACVWWGIALVAAESGLGAIGIVGAVVMTVLLRRVSGVTLVERSMHKRRPGYTDYVARASPFVPRSPRSAKLRP